MNLIPNGVTQRVARTALQTRAKSPQVFFAVGIVGVITGTVMACKATLKLEETLEVTKKEIENVKATHSINEELQTEESDGEYEKSLIKVYGVAAYRLTKLYGPAILVTGASVGLLTGSHVSMNRRNAALTAAYAAVSKSYDEYRDRVRDELGDDKELDLYHAAYELEAPDGKTKELMANSDNWSPHAQWFDEANRNWQNNPELNAYFIKCVQEYMNNRLQARGHVFLNEALDDLGLERTRAGQAVGWLLNDEGTNHIDFGMYEAINDDFNRGWEKNLILDFNVDGVIWDKI